MSYSDSLGNAISPYTLGISPAVSFSAKSATGPGTALDGLAVRSAAVLVVTTSAGVSAGSVQLQGSLDNVNWYSLGSAVTTSAASTTTQVVVASAYSRFVRANVATAITGGTVAASVGLSG
ncbi:hypothetical protein [Mycolicibacterium hodleri]|uniref:Uncharacterized protein n=1 Tax=Mycolicibacterium hodleri TaxID=49897 RepID=A0A502E2J4_9MYCO|nr:hypothetical protein [Mycolicibacterium hodleri]TPG31757.1 hypothetical protein EAH80_22825 [Mycolicibacterium hodleri]